jgi:hypothetical protein
MSILIAGRAIWSSKLCNAFLSEIEDSDEDWPEFQVYLLKAIPKCNCPIFIQCLAKNQMIMHFA